MLYYITYYLPPTRTADQTATRTRRKQHGGKYREKLDLRSRKNRNKFRDMALDGEESTPVPNLALEAIVKPAIREVTS